MPLESIEGAAVLSQGFHAFMPSRIFVVEAYALLCEQLVSFVERIGLEVCGTSASAEQALQQVPEMRTDLALVDVALPGMNGLELVAALQKRCPDVACLLISGHRSRAYVEQARQLGARGYVIRGNLAELRKAMRRILAGRSYFKDYD